MKYCGKCGQEILDEAVICVHCGASQEEEALKPAKKAGKLNVGMLVWSIINIVFGGVGSGLPFAFGAAALVMTILASTAKTEEKVSLFAKLAKIFNIVATALIGVVLCMAMLVVIFYVVYFVIFFGFVFAAV